jgi:pectinacetylesterase
MARFAWGMVAFELVFVTVACSEHIPTAALAQNDASGAPGATDAAIDVASDAPSDGKPPIVPCTPDESAPVPVDRCTTDPNNTTLPACDTWLKVELPGTVCSDGSQYKFFVNYSNTSNDVIVDFEPGGACWDYDSCSGNSGVRGAANPHGIPDDHMSNYQYLNHLRRTSDNPLQDYNMVFVSYCTGDVHTGNNVMTYTSDGPVEGGTGDGGTGQIVYRHAGHANTMAIIGWLQKTFATVPKLFVTGCSAGGAGSIINYAFIRQGMGANVQCGYLLDDSGPLFHSDGPSKQLHETIRSAWNVDPVLDSLDGQLPISSADIKNDFGLMNVAVARKYSHDRLSLALYRMDLNYSLYSYQRFFPGSTEADIHAMWWQDLQELMPTFDAEPNLAYYVPYFRTDNCSHCVSIPPIGNAPLEPTDNAKVLAMPWLGSEIQEDMIDLKQFTVDLVDDTKPLKSYLEGVRPNASFTPAESMLCMQGG